MAKAKTLAEVADNIAARQMGLKEQAALVRKEATDVNKKIHAAGGEIAMLDRLLQGETILSLARSLKVSHLRVIHGFWPTLSTDSCA